MPNNTTLTIARLLRLLLLPLAMACAAELSARAATLDLSGQWGLQLDPKDEGLTSRLWEKPLNDSIHLPGTTALARKGEPLDIPLNLERPAMAHLHERFRYIGPAWYRRTVRIPADWQGQDICLTLERVIWESRVWVNGEEVPGGPQLSLTTPHRFDLTGLLKPGEENTLVVRIDNREKVAIGDRGHSYTEETQTIWNGIVGRLELQALPKLRLDRLRLRPDLARGGVEVTLFSHNTTGSSVPVSLSFQCLPDNFLGRPAGRQSETVTLPQGETNHTFFYQMPAGFEKWSEFNPKVYRLQVLLEGDGLHSEKSGIFGMREFKAEGTQFTINGHKTFLRGDVQCAEFPQTGHPDMTGKQWKKIFTTAKAYGLNHFRFHSWCPPEVAFKEADEQGFYLHVELPNWTSRMGEDPAVDDWLVAEGERMLREYGNHPSWVMLSLGNELTGKLSKLDEMEAHFRQLEPRMLYTSTTYSFSPRGDLPGPNDNYFISQRTKSGWVRGQGFLNVTPPNTTSDYSEGLSCVPIPLVSHEVGQYVVYPDLSELPKYEATPLRATAWEAIKMDLEKKGRLSEAARYTHDSGELALLLYKEDLERALRTKGQAGIDLLQLQDFPGQGTATVGLLDTFWDSKGLVTAEQFHQFCAPTVPLARLRKFTWLSNEFLEADLEAAHFGEKPLTNITVRWSLRSGKKIVNQGSLKVASLPLGNGLPLGTIRSRFSAVTPPAQLTLEVEIPEAHAKNSWPLWVYPAAPEPPAPRDVVIAHSWNDSVRHAVVYGKTVLLLPSAAAIKKPLFGRFIPVFWSPLWFPNQPGTLGAMIDTEHPLWKEFPTSTYTDWQWWELTAKSVAVDLDGLDPAIAKPFRFVDKFNRNAMPTAIFEARVGLGKLLVCTLDVESDPAHRVAAGQLRRALFDYAASRAFKPKGMLSPEQLANLFGEREWKASASSEHADYPASLAADGDPSTIWHSDWTRKEESPITFTLDLLSTRTLAGFTYLPRQDQVNGRIARYSIQVSSDGSQWNDCGQPAEFPNNTELQTVRFKRPVQARYLRLTVLSDHSEKGYASAAEIAPLFATPSPKAPGQP